MLEISGFCEEFHSSVSLFSIHSLVLTIGFRKTNRFSARRRFKILFWMPTTSGIEGRANGEFRQAVERHPFVYE